MKNRGTIVTYSIVHSGTDEFKDRTPYVVALVERNQRKTIACIEGYTEQTDITIGMAVELLAEDELGHPSYRFAMPDQ